MTDPRTREEMREDFEALEEDEFLIVSKADGLALLDMADERDALIDTIRDICVGEAARDSWAWSAIDSAEALRVFLDDTNGLADGAVEAQEELEQQLVEMGQERNDAVEAQKVLGMRLAALERERDDLREALAGIDCAELHRPECKGRPTTTVEGLANQECPYKEEPDFPREKP